MSHGNRPLRGDVFRRALRYGAETFHALKVTNTDFISRGIKEKTVNAVLIKLNQIGTVTETLNAINLCRKAGWGYIVFHRSGETEDTFLADFTVTMGGGRIKLRRSENRPNKPPEAQEKIPPGIFQADNPRINGKEDQGFFVTHVYEFARSLFAEKREDAMFLRAERQADGKRTFRLLEGEPLQTSYGEDRYNRIRGR
jgi:hypothetical protein